MTADEMFQKQGYVRDFPNESMYCIVYSRDIRESEYPFKFRDDEQIQIRIWLNEKFVSSSLIDVETSEHYERDLNFSEILACAQLIKELQGGESGVSNSETSRG